MERIRTRVRAHELLCPRRPLFRIVGSVLVLICLLVLMDPKVQTKVVNSDYGSWWLDRRSASEKLEAAIRDGLKVWVVSHGGTGTWSFVDYLNSRGVQKTWLGTAHGMVHYPKPIWLRPSVAKRLRAAVYILDDPLVAICSMKSRGFHHNVYSYLRDRRIHLSSDIDIYLLDEIFNQFKAWTQPIVAKSVGYPVIWLKYSDSFNDSCLLSICGKLGTCKKHRRSKPIEGLSRSFSDATQPLRKTNISTPCVVELNARLSKGQKLKVQQLREFKGCIVNLNI